MRNQTKQRWLTLWNSIGAQGDANGAYEDLLARYKEPHRYYHTISHIEHCLAELDQTWYFAMDIAAVRMALWFHDAIYDTGAKDNEEKSAELAGTILKKASLPDKFIEPVVNLILTTKHNSPPTDRDAKLIADIDLSSLGAPDKIFNKNSRLIQKEYKWVPEEIFKAERVKILESFLKRKTIYYTQLFFEKYEAQARKNLTHAIAQLSK